MTKSAIAYIRVSTQKQGRSGLGLEAQQAQIAAFAAAEGLTIVETFVEVETGKGADALETRPQLAAAVQAARKATLIVAKLDRLTRCVHFGSGLMLRQDIKFRVADLPNADNFQLHIMLALAQKEREMISARTIAALAAAKARGVKLGNAALAKSRAADACAFAHGLRDVVTPLIRLPLRQIATQLNDRGITTPTGGKWHAQSIARVIDRLELAA